MGSVSRIWNGVVPALNGPIPWQSLVLSVSGSAVNLHTKIGAVLRFLFALRPQHLCC
jgi:hypothetical protein